MTNDQQMHAWRWGVPLHNHSAHDGQGMCCPDFACCRGEYVLDEPQRAAFVASDSMTRQRFMMFALGAALGKQTDKDVYIAGLDTEGTA